MTPPRATWHLLPHRPVRSVVLGDRRPGVPPLVAVPGLGALGYLLPALRVCASWTQVHLLDLPGFGHRATARESADLASTAAACAGWLERAVDEPVLLLGHSTGAQVALHAAVARPDRVHAVVAAGVTFAPEHRSAGPLAAQVLRTLPHERPGELAAVLPYYLRGARGLPVLLRTALRDAPEQTVAALPRPLLVLRGQRDGLCPASWAQALADAASSGRVVQVPGAHNTPYTHPDRTAAAIRSAL